MIHQLGPASILDQALTSLEVSNHSLYKPLQPLPHQMEGQRCHQLRGLSRRHVVRHRLRPLHALPLRFNICVRPTVFARLEPTTTSHPAPASRAPPAPPPATGNLKPEPLNGYLNPKPQTRNLNPGRPDTRPKTPDPQTCSPLP